jgi:hypothetical protein
MLPFWHWPARLQDFELCGHTVPKGTTMQCSLAQVLKTDSRWVGGWVGGAARMFALPVADKQTGGRAGRQAGAGRQVLVR